MCDIENANNTKWFVFYNMKSRATNNKNNKAIWAIQDVDVITFMKKVSTSMQELCSAFKNNFGCKPPDHGPRSAVIKTRPVLTDNSCYKLKQHLERQRKKKGVS